MSDVDPRLTERCLQAQPDVVSARAWIEDDRLIALVTVLEGTGISRRQLQRACRLELGPRLTPVAFDIVQARRAAA